MKAAVIIPALNEEKSITKVIEKIPPDLVEQIIVADNGSTDNTVNAAKSMGARIAHARTKGYGFACLAGLELLEDDIDTVVFLDGDYSDYPEEMPLLLEPIMNDEADLVIGSRTRGKREEGALPPHSVFGNHLAASLFSLLYGIQVTDIGPFRAIKRDLLEKMDMTPAAFRWTVEMMVKAVRLKGRIKEIPVRYRKRIGKSKITGTIMGTVLAGYYIISTMFLFRLWNENSRDS